MDTVTATLIVSLSGLSESTLPDAVDFAGELDTRLVPASWLLPPRPRAGRHLPDAPVIRWLRHRIQAGADSRSADAPLGADARSADAPLGADARLGDALVLHGFDHTVDPIGRWATSAVARIGRRAEFAALPSHEARLRLIAATRTMDDLGLTSQVFAPPRWLASAGTVVALRQRGFRVCADSVGVRRLDVPDHQALLRGRVLSADGVLSAGGVLTSSRVPTLAAAGPATLPTLATQEATEAWRHRALVASAARITRRGGLVRIAASAAELGRPATRRALLDAVDAALAAGAVPATYRRPVPTPAPLSA